MIKKIFYILLGVVICLACFNAIFSRRNQDVDPVGKDIETVKNIANKLEDELEYFGVNKEMIDSAISKIEELNEETKYIIEFSIQNNTNPILSTTLHLPVYEEFFNSVEVGDVIAEEELKKIADLAHFNENIGDWTIAIKDKVVRD